MTGDVHDWRLVAAYPGGVSSPAKTAAARENGKKGRWVKGRSRKKPEDTELTSAASVLGKIGGSKTSDAKKTSSAANGLKGGRPKNLRGGRPKKNP